MLTALLQISTQLATAQATAIPALIASQMPALQNLKMALAGLNDAQRKSLAAEIRAAAVKGGGTAPQVAATALRLAGLFLHPQAKDADTGTLLLYLQLWLLDQLVIADFSARNLPFDHADPAPDYWYPRTDTAGTHQFNTDGCYLINTIPPATLAAYSNAEIYNSTQTVIQPRNVIANLFPVDDAQTDPKDFLYDLFLNVPYVPQNGLRFEAEVKAENLKGGSRGWGFWNTDVFPFSMQIAWFIQLDGKTGSGDHPFYPNGFYAVVQNGLTGGYSQKLPDLDEGWHSYRIDVKKASVEFFIDDKPVFTTPKDEADMVPTGPMSFHNWVDNAVFGMDQSGMIVHILQATDAPRSNRMRKLRLSNLAG